MPFLSAHSGVGHSGGSGGSGGDWLRPGSSAAAAARSASSSAAGRRGQHRRPAPSNRGAGGAISSKRKRRHPAPSSGIGARLARAYSCRKWLTRWADQGARAAIGFDPVARPPRQRARRPAPPPAGAASIVGQRRPTAAPAARSHQNENAVIRRRHLELARASRARIVAENG